jgi:hypothetical protein
MKWVRSLECASVCGRTSLETKVHNFTFLHFEFHNKHYTEECSKQRPQLAGHQPAYICPAHINPSTQTGAIETQLSYISALVIDVCNTVSQRFICWRPVDKGAYYVVNRKGGKI